MIQKSDIKIFVGLDPGVNDNFGIATKKIGARDLDTVSSGNVETICSRIYRMYLNGEKPAVVLEDPNLNKPVFGALERLQAIMRSGNQATIKAQFSSMMMQAQNVGKNKACAIIVIRFCQNHGIPLIKIAPSARQKIDDKKVIIKNPRMYRMPTKVSKEQFKALTKFTGKTNEHGRDAATLISFLTFPQFSIIHIRQENARKAKENAKKQKALAAKKKREKK